VCQVAKRYGWEDANKMARRKGGKYDDLELAKVLEEREKKEEKAKREHAKVAASNTAKRGRFIPGPGAGQTRVLAMEHTPTTARSLWLISLLLNFEGDMDTVTILKRTPHQTSSVSSVEGMVIISKTARTGKHNFTYELC
jgi:hypothetical protein